ncbi:MAG: WYL domain-containing protein [Marinicellaceae bacterium]
MLTAWCEKRQDFRNFRIDRIQDLRINDEKFDDDPGKNLAAYLYEVKANDR